MPGAQYKMVVVIITLLCFWSSSFLPSLTGMLIDKLQYIYLLFRQNPEQGKSGYFFAKCV